MGSLNKIPLSVAGIVLFHVPTSLENSASIFFGMFSPFSMPSNMIIFVKLLKKHHFELHFVGLVAGVFFAKAKMRERSQS